MDQKQNECENVIFAWEKHIYAIKRKTVGHKLLNKAVPQELFERLTEIY